jgi:hypothetical protein
VVDGEYRRLSQYHGPSLTDSACLSSCVSFCAGNKLSCPLHLLTIRIRNSDELNVAYLSVFYTARAFALFKVVDRPFGVSLSIDGDDQKDRVSSGSHMEVNGWGLSDC